MEVSENDFPQKYENPKRQISQEIIERTSISNERVGVGKIFEVPGTKVRVPGTCF